jgi:modulator of FtsH protease
MNTLETTYDDTALGREPIPVDRIRGLIGQVMGFVAITVGFTALGAYLGRDLSGSTGLLLFIPALACVVGLNVAAGKGRQQLAVGLLFGVGLLLGLVVAPVISAYAEADPTALWQATGATAAFVAACGALYQLIRQRRPIVDRTFEITFLDAGVEAYAFTFG